MKRYVISSVLGAAALLTPQASTGRAMMTHSGPLPGTWTIAPSMLAPVTSHQAVVLHDGRILVIGGEPMPGWPVPWAQLYDPSTRAWSAEESMHVARIGESVTVLHDGRVLVVGGLDQKLKDLDSAEIFDPRTGAWQSLPPLPQPRFSQSASLLPNGRVLLVGGIVGGVISRTTLLFDPTLERFLPGGATHLPHAQQCSVTLDHGRVLIAGGYGGGAEIYDSRSNTWTVVGPTSLRTHPIMNSLPDGTVLLASGVNAREHDLNSARIFHPAHGTWTTTGALHVQRDAATGTLLRNGRVLVAGGEQVSGHLLRSAELYDSTRHSWSLTGDMHVARAAPIAVLLQDGTVLVCGGANFHGPLASCEVYHPEVPGLTPRSHRTMDATASIPR
jgi:Kelch motif